MKIKTAIKIAMVVFAACFTQHALATDTVISDVMVRQRWPWSRLVDIDYVMTCDSTQQLDIMVVTKDGVDSLALPLSSFTGDLYGVSCGPHRIVWDPTKTAYTNNQILTQFSVALIPTPPPLYMIVDLTKSAGAADQIEYATEAAITNNEWGAWIRNPVTNDRVVVKSVVWLGVTTNDIYKTDKLVLRRVPAGSYQMGETQTGDNDTTLTNDMYVGVFEVTQQQWDRIMNGTSGTDMRAKFEVSYYQIRENPNNTDDPAVDWPSNTAVNPSSFMGKLRTKTGIPEFDLPTEAQWEYFCRAGTTTIFNDGIANALYTGVIENNNGNTNQYLNVLGWYKYSEPIPPANTRPQPVGGKLPNAWGLYDTHGNVLEWCLDWHAMDDHRVIRGGSWFDRASLCRSASRDASLPTGEKSRIGFRLVRTLP